jgi:hypothetical protein
MLDGQFSVSSEHADIDALVQNISYQRKSKKQLIMWGCFFIVDQYPQLVKSVTANTPRLRFTLGFAVIIEIHPIE